MRGGEAGDDDGRVGDEIPVSLPHKEISTFWLVMLSLAFLPSHLCWGPWDRGSASTPPVASSNRASTPTPPPR